MSLEDEERLHYCPGLRVGERGVDVLERVGLGELIDREPALLPQLDEPGDEHLGDRTALDDGLERPALAERAANLERCLRPGPGGADQCERATDGQGAGQTNQGLRAAGGIE